MVSTRIPEYMLHELFRSEGIWDGLESGSLTERIETSHVPARLCSMVGARSYFSRVFRADGVAVARIHYVDCPVAGIIGRWPSALKVADDVTVYRIGHGAQ